MTAGRLRHLIDRPVRVRFDLFEEWRVMHCLGLSALDPECVLRVAEYGQFGEVLAEGARDLRLGFADGLFAEAVAITVPED